MSDYILLCRFTEKGVKEIKDSPNRITNVKKLFESNGGKVKTLYAVLGRFDTVAIVEAADDETIARISLQISGMGAVHIETLRAFTEQQYLDIVKKI